jgi:hypothetical protein
MADQGAANIDTSGLIPTPSAMDRTINPIAPITTPRTNLRSDWRRRKLVGSRLPRVSKPAITASWWALYSSNRDGGQRWLAISMSSTMARIRGSECELGHRGAEFSRCESFARFDRRIVGWLSAAKPIRASPRRGRRVGFAEFTIGPAEGGTRWLNPPYGGSPIIRRISAGVAPSARSSRSPVA